MRAEETPRTAGVLSAASRRRSQRSPMSRTTTKPVVVYLSCGDPENPDRLQLVDDVSICVSIDNDHLVLVSM